MKFSAIVNHEVAALLEHEPKKLTGQVLWKCYFKTRPATLELTDVETNNVDKKRSHSFRVDRFQVDGKVLKINKESVTVEIKFNTTESDSFTLTLKGSFEYDKSCPFWRFKLIREGKSYVIQSAVKLPLPRVEKAPPPPPPPKKEKKAKAPPPPKQQKKKEPEPIPTYPPSLYKKKPQKTTPTPQNNVPSPTTEPTTKKRVFNLVDKSKKG